MMMNERFFRFILANPPLAGATIFGNENSSASSSLMALNFPWDISVNSDNSMLITDMLNVRVLHVFSFS